MNVLIFGGTGFLGGHLTKELLSKGYQVSIVTRNRSTTKNKFSSNVEIIEWDNLSPLPSSNQLRKIDAVINLAGESIGNRRWSSSVKMEILNSRINTTRYIVHAINEGSLEPKVLINASAVGYYGPRHDEMLIESEEPGQDFLAEVCRNWEREAYKVKSELTRVVTVRTGVVLGSQGALTRMVTPFKLYVGGPLGNGNQWLSWIHIQDLISIFRFIIEHDEVIGPVNGTAPHPERMRDFAKILGKVLKRPAWFPVPEFLLKIVLGQMSEMLLHGQRAIPQKILDAGFKFEFSDLTSALEDIIGEGKLKDNKGV